LRFTTNRDPTPSRFALALAVSAAVVLTSPFVADLRDALRRAAGTSYGTVLNLLVLGAVGVAIAVAAVRIRNRRAERYAAIVTACAAGVSYVWVNALPGIERFHFVEYGIVTVLFYRAVQPYVARLTGGTAADPSILIVPALAALIVATADEWVQWFVPRRYGEVRDLALNAAAIGCGLLFSAGLDPPPGWRLRPTPRSLALMTALGAASVVTLGAFLMTVHLGYVIPDDEIGRFRSRHTASALLALADDRRTRWGGGAVPEPSRLSREDQYLTEGLWHVQMRNEAWGAGAVDTAWRENRILEKYFDPVLTAGHAWPAAQRADAASRRGPSASGAFVSRAERYPILAWNQALFAGSVLAAAFFLLAISFTSSRWC
jgi:hypothetical protein